MSGLCKRGHRCSITAGTADLRVRACRPGGGGTPSGLPPERAQHGRPPGVCQLAHSWSPLLVLVGAGIASVSGVWVLACAEAAAEQEVLAVGLLKGLAEGGGFLAVAAPEVGELGGQRAHDA